MLGNRELSDKRVPVPEIDIRSDRKPIPSCRRASRELLVRGPSVMKGYLDNESRTGGRLPKMAGLEPDIAAVDENGYVHILGRVKEIILHGGNTIYPQEVDTAILEFSNKVLDVMTFGSRTTFTERMWCP